MKKHAQYNWLTPTVASIRIGIFILLSMLLAGCQGGYSYTKPDSDRPLSGDDVKELISGNTFNTTFKSYPFTIYHNPDGSLVSTIFSNPDTGTWKIKEGDRYCFQWVEFFRGEERCYQWFTSGERYSLVNVDSFRTFNFGGTLTQGRPPGY